MQFISYNLIGTKFIPGNTSENYYENRKLLVMINNFYFWESLNFLLSAIKICFSKMIQLTWERSDFGSCGDHDSLCLYHFLTIVSFGGDFIGGSDGTIALYQVNFVLLEELSNTTGESFYGFRLGIHYLANVRPHIVHQDAPVG